MPILNWLNKGQATQTAAACEYHLLAEIRGLFMQAADVSVIDATILLEPDPLEFGIGGFVTLK